MEFVCVECWEEWWFMEVWVINEFKFNFMDFEFNKKLIEYMCDFFKFD